MAHATATHSNGICTITLPSNSSNMVLMPKTSGNAQWINYCLWQDVDSTKSLGEWSAQRENMDVVSNPYDLINSTTKHGTITKNTNPSITGIKTTSLTFTHKTDSEASAKPDKLKVNVIPAGDNITVITIFAEDTGDNNYLDFQMIITITDK